MNPSIRKYLLIHLLFGITIITSIAALGNYYLDEKTIDGHLDNWLSQSAVIFQAIIGNDLDKRDLKNLEQFIQNIPNQVSSIIEEKPYKGRFQFQVWNNKGMLLLRSHAAPLIPLSQSIGFSTQEIDADTWRVYSLYNEKTGLTIMVGERLDIRKELGNLIARDEAYMLLICYPVLGFVIWFIVGHGLNTIRRVAKEVGHRAPNYLEPVDLHAVPLEIKPLVDELNQLFLRLQQGFEREKSFSANAAHELRTPLAALKTQAQVALRATSEKERKDALAKLIASVDRSSHVVQQLLTLSRLVPEAALQEVTRFNLPKLTAEIIAQLAPFAIEKDIEIELIGGENRATIEGNPTAVGILIRNLVDNAIRYTDAGGQISVYIHKNNHTVSLRVVDNGPGIPPELRSQVFERFFRILGTKSPGSGLGLAIVQQITQLHKAQVSLGTPTSGKGLEVEVTFRKSLQQ